MNNVKPIHSSRISFARKMETIGDTFKRERIKQKKTLDVISQDTKIEIRKLKALEENDFKSFESSVSTKGFIKIYSEYLNLEPEKILAIYRRDFGEKKTENRTTNVLPEKNKASFSFKHIFLAIPIILIFIIVGYLYNQFSDFQNPPNLEVFEPENNSIVNENSLTIKGKTDHDAIVDIGDTKIPVDENGNFTASILIEQGNNIITIRTTSARNPSSENVEILYITYEPIEEEDLQEDEIVEKIDLKIKVQNSPTWIEVIIDDQMIISQILQVGYEKEFEAKRNVQVNTGIIQNTNVEINGEFKIISSEDFSLRCEIIEEEINCQ